jgi:hypothetical protein
MAAKIFGQIVWEVFQERPERWASQEAGVINGKEVKGRTYFRLQHWNDFSQPAAFASEVGFVAEINALKKRPR